MRAPRGRVPAGVLLVLPQNTCKPSGALHWRRASLRSWAGAPTKGPTLFPPPPPPRCGRPGAAVAGLPRGSVHARERAHPGARAAPRSSESPCRIRAGPDTAAPKGAMRPCARQPHPGRSPWAGPAHRPTPARPEPQSPPLGLGGRPNPAAPILNPVNSAPPRPVPLQCAESEMGKQSNRPQHQARPDNELLLRPASGPSKPAARAPTRHGAGHGAGGGGGCGGRRGAGDGWSCKR